jgi:hypothetical protein
MQTGHFIHDVAERSKPALEAAGIAIKDTASTVVETTKPAVERVSLKPSHTKRQQTSAVGPGPERFSPSYGHHGSAPP